MIALLRSLFPLSRLARPGRQPGARSELAYWCAALVVFLVAALLRLVWVRDIEYKADEELMYNKVLAVRAGEPWPALGFPSSQNAPAHGMMIWVFLALDHVYAADSPPELARMCQCLNLLAIVGLLVFIRTSVSVESRGVWLWAAALVAVNPVAMLFHRKIWPVAITPPFLVLVLVGFWYRDRRWGAALWGAMVQVVGMIHVGGLFLAVALALWALAFDRRRVQWRWWAGGSAAVAWGLLPWLYSLATTHVEPTGKVHLTNPLTFNYWLRLVSEPFGIGSQQYLGDDYWDLLRYPLVGGRETYLLGAAFVGQSLIGLTVLLGAIVRAWRNRRGLLARFSGTDRQTPFVVGAVCIGYGLAISLSCFPIFQHYMILTFPMMFVGAAFLALCDRTPVWRGWTRGQALLLGSCVLQFAVSAGLLAYVHNAGRTINGEYGTPYAAQIEFGLPQR